MFNQRTSVLDYLRKPVDPKELVRKWQSDLRAEVRKTERSILGPCGVERRCCPGTATHTEIEREKKKTEKAIRDAAKRNDLASAKVLQAGVWHHKRTLESHTDPGQGDRQQQQGHQPALCQQGADDFHPRSPVRTAWCDYGSCMVAMCIVCDTPQMILHT